MISLTSPINTPYHQLPAGLKLGLLCLSTMLLFAVEQWLTQLVILLFVAGLYTVAGVGFIKEGARHLWLLWPFIVVILLWHGYNQTFYVGMTATMRMLNAVALANLVTMSTTLTEMIAVVRWLLRPAQRLGVQTHAVELAIAMAVRFIPVFLNKTTDLMRAWRARSTKRVSWRVLLPFVVLAIDDAEQVAEALKARGGVRKNRTTD